jgi:hypothetical protein
MALRNRARNYAYRHVGRSFLAKVLNYYRFNANDRNKIVIAYNKYLNARSNLNRKNAHNNAKQAASQFVTTLFEIYEKAANRPRNGVSSGLRNGVRNTVLYWLPGLLYRGAVRHITGPRIQNNLN